MRVRLHQGALRDLMEGYEFYEGQAEGLGAEFLESMMSDLRRLGWQARIYPRYWSYHRLLDLRFPFAVYYRIEEDAANVYAILDCRRDPRRIRARLS